MELFWSIGVVFSIVSCVLLLLAVLGLARQLGVLLARTAPTRAQPTVEGPDIGSLIEPVVLPGYAGSTIPITPTKGLKQLLVFTDPSCSTCKDLMPAVRAFAAAYRDDIRVTILSRSEENERDLLLAADLAPVGIGVASATDLHQRLQVLGVPYAILLDTDNKVLAKGTVNTLEQMESLLSIEAYIDKHLPPVPVDDRKHDLAGTPAS